MLRIIAGRWRGRRLRFPPLTQIRPTPDRVRETLFNWLGARVHGSRCLDLFSGSGALGLEALSRGAAEVTFVEQEVRAAQQLGEHLAAWGAEGAQVVSADALRFLAAAPRHFDVVFLDPPFGSGLLTDSAAMLEAHGWLAPEALIYVETDGAGGLPALPSAWQLTRSGRAGAVGYHLLRRADGRQASTS